MSVIAERLAEERQRLEITQGDAALVAGVSRTMWGQYERGQATPNADVLLRLLAVGWDVNYCLGGTRSYNHGQIDADLMAECMAAVTDVLDAKGLVMPPKALAELVSLIYEQESALRAAPGAAGDVTATTARVLRLVKSA